jgi:hypothetical protein
VWSMAIRPEPNVPRGWFVKTCPNPNTAHIEARPKRFWTSPNCEPERQHFPFGWLIELMWEHFQHGPLTAGEVSDTIPNWNLACMEFNRTGVNLSLEDSQAPRNNAGVCQGLSAGTTQRRMTPQ